MFAQKGIRIVKTHIETALAPRPVGAYSQGVRLGNTIQVSGQVGIDPATSSLAGETTYAQTVQTLRNIRAILQGGRCRFR